MAQPQPQLPQMPQVPQLAPQMQQMQQRPSFPPTQHSPSPAGTPQPAYALPPNKRPRTETGPTAQQQPTYLPQQSYAMSPQTQAPPASVASPNYAASPSTASPQNYSSPYTNGAVPLSMPTPTSATTPHPTISAPLTIPEARQTLTPSPSTPVTPLMPNQQMYTNATMMPIAPPPPGTMGPPSKPAERPTREYEYDVSDSLAGTGIDLRAEEQALADYYAGSFGQDARTGLPANAPGSKASMYGAGWANQPPQLIDGQSQEQFAAEAAKKAWEEAAQRLAVSRSNEMKDPFISIPLIHHRAEKIAKEHGISLNLDSKNAVSMGKFKHPLDISQPKVAVTTKTGPDGAMVSTKGSWIPHDAYLVDQIALLSIATKHRLRELVEEAFTVAINRQTTAHGEVPEEWADVAMPLRNGLDLIPEPESAMSPLTNPLKRSFDAANPQSSKPVGSRQASALTKAIRETTEGDRKMEDLRLKKRQKRLNPEPATGSRAGSIAPGTPGSVAPETETKAPSKKELKKGAAAAKLAEASSTASANQTLSTLMGGFGGRKKGKQYSWMTSGGSGASTPNRLNIPSTPGAATPAGTKTAQEMRLTGEGRYRIGSFVEYEPSHGKHVQLRDWVTVLEIDGVDIKAIQDAYAKLDAAGLKG